MKEKYWKYSLIIFIIAPISFLASSSAPAFRKRSNNTPFSAEPGIVGNPVARSRRIGRSTTPTELPHPTWSGVRVNNETVQRCMTNSSQSKQS